MTLEQQQKHFESMIEKMREVLFKKGNDYANQDRLSNFKLAGNISGGSAEINCLNLIATKVARLGVLLNSTATPNNESIRDSVLDLANYAVLLDMILSEKALSYEEVAYLVGEKFKNDLLLDSISYYNTGKITGPGDADFVPELPPTRHDAE